MRPLVLYHGSCPDGFCAAWCAHRRFGDEADYLPVNYGQSPPDVTGRDVFILDFSYKRAVMLEMTDKAAHTVVLDHHKTAVQELDGLVHDGRLEASNALFVLDVNKSGGRLSWEYFFPGKTAPWLVDYTEDRDLWRWKLPESREVSACLASWPWTFEEWDKLALDTTARIHFAEQGTAILRYQQQQVEAQAKNATETVLDGHKVKCVNATMLISEIAGKLAEGNPFGATYFIRGDGKKVWSLRSRDGGVDVSEIAKRHGGGGHRNAAGFEEAHL